MMAGIEQSQRGLAGAGSSPVSGTGRYPTGTRTHQARVKAAADSIAAGTLVAAPRPASMQAWRPAQRAQSLSGHRSDKPVCHPHCLSEFAVSSVPLW